MLLPHGHLAQLDLPLLNLAPVYILLNLASWLVILECYVLIAILFVTQHL